MVGTIASAYLPTVRDAAVHETPPSIGSIEIDVGTDDLSRQSPPFPDVRSRRVKVAGVM